MSTKPPTRKKAPPPAAPPPFHLRFEIELPTHDAHKRFINRVANLVFENFVETDDDRSLQAYWNICNILGEEHKSYNNFKTLARDNLLRALQCIEGGFKSLKDAESRQRFEIALTYAISLGEVDLSVTWEDGHFRRSGSTLLDEGLINDPLGTLRQLRFVVVREPLVKALRHLLEAERRPELLADVVTDAYEALEACAKVITERTGKDLSANADSLVSGLKISSSAKDALRAQLKAYITYGNVYRHANATAEKRTPPSKIEAEAFVYQTGLFIRLATGAA